MVSLRQVTDQYCFSCNFNTFSWIIAICIQVLDMLILSDCLNRHTELVHFALTTLYNFASYLCSLLKAVLQMMSKRRYIRPYQLFKRTKRHAVQDSNYKPIKKAGANNGPPLACMAFTVPNEFSEREKSSTKSLCKTQRAPFMKGIHYKGIWRQARNHCRL